MSRIRFAILILEDVPMDAELVEYELARARIPFESRLRGHPGAVPRASSTSSGPDLILSDYTLPRFDGMAALTLARERAPAVPFLIVTGSVNEETAVGCMKAGATDYLLKSNLARIGPAIEARARPSPGPGREGARRGGAAAVGGQPAGDLQHQPAGLRAGGPRTAPSRR